MSLTPDPARPTAAFDRRAFLKTGIAAAATAGATTWTASSYGRIVGANERVRLAFVGPGGRGGLNLAYLAGVTEQDRAPHAGKVAGTEVAALCEVDLRPEGPRQPVGSLAFEQFPEATKFRDWRVMLERAADEIDGVVVSTPNHLHAPVSLAAMRLGLHVYCEKPGSHSVHETRAMAEEAARSGVATQLGTQVHSSENYRRIVELLRSGAIGEVEACHIWLRSGTASSDRPAETPPVPERLDWDLWLGPAPERPYHPDYLPTRWHRWWDFGGGIQLGNMGCHYLDLPFWALELGHPATVESKGPPPHPETAPEWQRVRYTFERGEGLAPFLLTWNHGREMPAPFAEHRPPDWAWGLFVGSKGLLAVDYERHQLLPEERFEGFEAPERLFEPSRGHYQEWVDGCRGEGVPLCHFGYSMRVAETVLLGNVAHRSERRLEWDAANLAIPNAPEAERYLRRAYRPGWE